MEQGLDRHARRIGLLAVLLMLPASAAASSPSTTIAHLLNVRINAAKVDAPGNIYLAGQTTTPLGFGGIGEVCKARDTRLNRYGGVEPPTHRGHLRGGRSRANHWTWQMRAIPESARRASIGRNTMNEIDREEALSLLIKNCGLTESEAKACLRNPLVTMLIIPILERLNRIESQLNQK
jgi:hypothetical protein